MLNRSYRLIFNRSLQVWQAVSKLARSAGKSSGAVQKPALAVILSLAAGTAMAQEVIDGSTITVPSSGHPSPWLVGDDLIVGNNGNGTLIIETGGQVTSTDGYIGDNAGSTGTATVTGPGSSWTNSGNLFVGYSGSATLTIENGGKVTNDDSYIGTATTGNGRVIVTGLGSSWTNSANLNVGHMGNGTLTITDGGQVTNTYGSIGRTLGTGTVTVTGPGSSWINSNALYVGSEGNGTLTIEDGGKVRNTGGRVGAIAGGTGTATVTGLGSSWTSSASLLVGSDGTGTLTIADGGQVTNTYGYIGDNAGSTGTATVSGAGSSWTNSGDLTVGRAGSGTLNIEDGGKVTNTDGVIGGSGISTGTTTVTGAGSTWTNSGKLTVGRSGYATFTIENGGKVTNTDGVIGSGPSGTGRATVTGTGSTWTNSGDLTVGSSGSATLTIENGGTVSSLSTVLGSLRPGFGALNLNGSSSARGVLATNHLRKGAGTAAFNWNGGILRASAASSNFLPGFSAGDIKVLSGGAFFDTQGFNVAITPAGILAGAGGLTKMGSGTLTLAGSNTYGGDTTVAAGTLAFDTYNQSASQTLGIGARNTADYGKLKVTGTATFNANANITVDVAAAPTLANNAILSDVITAGTLTANGFNVTDNSALFNFEPMQNANRIDLKVVANSTSGIRDAVSEYGYTSALGAADILDAQLNSGGDMANVISAFGQLSNNRDVARAAMQTLPVMSGTQAIQGALSSFQTVVQNHNESGDGATGLSPGDELSNKHVWVRGFGAYAKQDDYNGVSGFSADSRGLAVGADTQVSRDAHFGLAYGYAKTTVDGNTDISGTAQRANIDSHVVALYGSKDFGNQRTFSFLTDMGVNNNESSRQLNFGGLNRTATADYRTYSAHAGARLAQAFALSAATTLTPSVRADYMWIKAQRYSETGADALNLNVASQKSEAFVIGADAHLQHRYSPRATLNANFGVGYDTINDSSNVVAAYAGAPGQSFIANGVDRTPWLVRGGISYIYTTISGTEITVRYDAEGRTDYLNQTASLRASWVF